MRVGLTSSCAVLVLVLTARAHAEDVVLFPPSGDDALLDAQRDAHRALLDALEDQGMRVHGYAEVSAGVSAGASTEQAKGCRTVDCAPALLRDAELDLAAAVAVWASEGSKSVFVTLVDARGNRFPGKAEIHERDVVGAATSALLDARALMLIGPGPWLHVHGKPEGAEVVLSGKVIGTTPLRTRVESGRHVLEVRAEGHKSFVQSVDVPPNAARQVDVSVSLEAREGFGGAGAPDAALGTDYDEPKPGSPVISFVAGGVLAAAGAALVAYGIVGLAAKGDCEERDGIGRCTQEVSPGAVVTVGLVAGGVALAGAVVMFVVQPIRTGGDGGTALVTVRGSF